MTANMFDRTVHAKTADGGEVVRYDRAGKYRVEYGDGCRSRRVTLGEAVELATADGAQVFLDRAGGMRFDSEVRTVTGERKCPSCGMTGWNGINLHRNRRGVGFLSGCSCCGFCY